MKKRYHFYTTENYTEVLDYQIEQNENLIYAYKAKLAEALKCQRSYLSQVLAGKTHFTLEHAHRACSFWKFTQTETDYFIFLVEYNRAGTQELKHFFLKKMAQIRKDQENITKRIQVEDILPDTKAAILYSNWYFIAILALLTIPQFRTLASIAQRLSLKEDLVAKALDQLTELGFIFKAGQEWSTKEFNMHLPNFSPFNSLNHSHWRAQAVQNSFLNQEDTIHYTSVSTLSLKDAMLIKELVFKLIDEVRSITTPSKEEELYCLTCDWFRV